MTWFSLHGGHSGSYCRHAKGTLVQVVQRALAAGFTTYGLSEHGPRYRDCDRYPDELDISTAEMRQLFRQYVVDAVRLADEYADRIELLVGFETETVPPKVWADRMAEVRASLPRCDYVVGSVHNVGDWCIDASAQHTAAAAEAFGGREALEAAYFAQVAEMVERLRPEVVGHLDLIRKFDGEAAELTASGRRGAELALQVVRDIGGLLDVNAAPARRGMGAVYPLPWILRRACELEIPVTLGDDSHGPQDVGVGLDSCVQAIAAAGYREVHYLTRLDGVVTTASVALDQLGPS